MVLIHGLYVDDTKLDEKALAMTSYIGKGLNLLPHNVQVNQDRRVRVSLAASVEVWKFQIDSSIRSHK